MNMRSVQMPVVLVLLLTAPLAQVFAQAVATPAGIVTPVTAPMILGVVSGGTAVELLADGFETVEGPLPQLDDGLLFTNSRMNRVLRLAPDGKLAVWFEGPGGANALTRTPEGDIVATMTESRMVAVLQPGQPPRPLVADFEGTQFNRPNDLIADTSRQHLLHGHRRRHAQWHHASGRRLPDHAARASCCASCRAWSGPTAWHSAPTSARCTSPTRQETE